MSDYVLRLKAIIKTLSAADCSEKREMERVVDTTIDALENMVEEMQDEENHTVEEPTEEEIDAAAAAGSP